MNKYGFVRVAAATPNIKVADVDYNTSVICKIIDEAYDHKVDVIVFPELCITGYTCQDLFHNETLIHAAEEAIKTIHHHMHSKLMGTMAIIGSPAMVGEKLYNSAYVITGISDEIVARVDKTYLPNYNEFYEKRWFTPADKENNTIITHYNNDCKFSFGVELCEDLWAVTPPSNKLALNGADIIFNLSASNDILGKHDYLKSLISQQSARCICGYVYASCGFGESTQDVVFGGKQIIAANGKIIFDSPNRFSTEGSWKYTDIDVEALRRDRIHNITFQDNAKKQKMEVKRWTNIMWDKNLHFKHIAVPVNPHPFYSDNEENMNHRCEEIMAIQVNGLAKRMLATGSKPVIGVSGGSDSTLALLVAYEACRKLHKSPEDIIGITMPGFATSKRTHGNSDILMGTLGITAKTIDICDMCTAHMKGINHDTKIQDVTYENVQARMRTMILMDIANQEGGMVIGTGDLSELALGWCTYNADHMSMYNVNGSIPKTLVKKEIAWYARTTKDENLRKVLEDILATPVSPELTGSGAEGTASQVTEDKIGPYELHDFFLYNTLRHGFSPDKILYLAEHSLLAFTYSHEEITKWLKVFIKRFFTNQFKRSCMPDCPKVGTISLSPRGDWRMPSDASYQKWIDLIR